MLYQCQDCGYSTNRKNNFDKHISKVNPCNQGKFECEYCHKKFSNKRSLKPHLEICEEHNSINIANNGNQNFNNSNNNHITNNNSHNQNINIEKLYVINPFGKENKEYITDEIISELLKKKGGLSIIELIKMIHFNLDHPENSNFHLMSRHSNKYIYYKDTDIWKAEKFHDFVVELLLKTAYDIIDVRDTNPDKFPKRKLELFNLMKDAIEKPDENKEKHNYCIDEIIKLLLTFHEFIIDRKKNEKEENEKEENNNKKSK